MNRVFLALVLLMCLAASAPAETMTLGVHGGSSIPSLRSNGGNEISNGWSSRLAPSFGVFADIRWSQAVSFQAEVNYAGQGGKKDGLQPIITDLSGLPVPPGMPLYADFKNVAKLDYLEIPVLAKYHLGPARRFSLCAGPYVGFLLSAKTVTSGMSRIYFDAEGEQPVEIEGEPLPPQDFGATTDGKSDLHVFNWGFQAGLAAAYPLGPGDVSLEVRGGLGLVNIQKDAETNGKNSTGNLVIEIGYGLPLGGL